MGKVNRKNGKVVLGDNKVGIDIKNVGDYCGGIGEDERCPWVEDTVDENDGVGFKCRLFDKNLNTEVESCGECGRAYGSETMLIMRCVQCQL